MRTQLISEIHVMVLGLPCIVFRFKRGSQEDYQKNQSGLQQQADDEISHIFKSVGKNQIVISRIRVLAYQSGNECYGDNGPCSGYDL